MVSDPQNQITTLILYIYSFQSFIPSALNQASRYEDDSKVQSLGPFEFMISKILELSPSRRTDISSETRDKFQRQGITLFKGSSVTQSQLQFFSQMVGTGQPFPSLGITSTHLTRKQAEEFAVGDI